MNGKKIKTYFTIGGNRRIKRSTRLRISTERNVDVSVSLNTNYTVFVSIGRSPTIYQFMQTEKRGNNKMISSITHMIVSHTSE